MTDEGNYILHCRFDGMSNPVDLDARLLTRAGVVGTALLPGRAHQAIIGRASGVGVRRSNV